MADRKNDLLVDRYARFAKRPDSEGGRAGRATEDDGRHTRNWELSSWRGRSGRRYVVGVHPLSASEIFELANAVILAVRRDGDGAARLIDLATEASARAALARRMGCRSLRARRDGDARPPPRRDRCGAARHHRRFAR